MNDLSKKALNRMLARRKELQAEYDRLISEPLSFGVTGSVTAKAKGDVAIAGAMGSDLEITEIDAGRNASVYTTGTIKPDEHKIY